MRAGGAYGEYPTHSARSAEGPARLPDGQTRFYEQEADTPCWHRGQRDCTSERQLTVDHVAPGM